MDLFKINFSVTYYFDYILYNQNAQNQNNYVYDKATVH